MEANSNLDLKDHSKSRSAKSKLMSSTADTDCKGDASAPQLVKLMRGRRRKPPAELRWTRLSLAELWDCSERKIDRLRDADILGEPVGYVGRSPIWSDRQRLDAEAAGLKRHSKVGDPEK